MTLFVASALAVLSAGPALAANDSPFASDKVTAPSYQADFSAERGYSAANDFRPSSTNAYPVINVGSASQAGNVDPGLVTSSVSVKHFPDAGTEQFKVSDD